MVRSGMRIRPTAENVAAIIFGIGLGLIASVLLVERFGVETRILGFFGMMVSATAALWVYFMQKR